MVAAAEAHPDLVSGVGFVYRLAILAGVLALAAPAGTLSALPAGLVPGAYCTGSDPPRFGAG